MQALFMGWLKDPEHVTFAQLRAAMVSHRSYAPYSGDLDQAAELVGKKEFDAARKRIQEGFPNLLLSPRAHFLLAMIARELGSEQDEKLEGYLAFRCIEGILSTGDGTRDKPFQVLRTTDEYDVMMAKQKQMTGQALIHDGSRHFDRITFDDESEYWFDITDSYTRLASQFVE